MPESFSYSKAAKRFPTLVKLLKEGLIKVTDSQEYVGTAKDGIEVSIGTVGCEKQAEAYLSTHSSPEHW